MQPEVHTLPSIYKFKKAKQSIDGMLDITHFVHSYLKDMVIQVLPHALIWI